MMPDIGIWYIKEIFNPALHHHSTYYTHRYTHKINAKNEQYSYKCMRLATVLLSFEFISLLNQVQVGFYFWNPCGTSVELHKL